MSRVGLEPATLRLQEKHLNLLCHGGVLILYNPGMVLPLQSSPKSSTTTDKLLEDFSVLGITGMAGAEVLKCDTYAELFNLPHQTT